MIQNAQKNIYRLYFLFAAKFWTLLRARLEQFPSILPNFFAKVAIFSNIVAFSMPKHIKNEHEIHRLGTFARDDLVIPPRLSEK